MKDSTFAKFVLLVNGLVPLGMMSYDALQDRLAGTHERLGANPPEFWLHTTGLLALIFLTLTLTITPARKISGYNFLSHFRRSLGLFAFFYASLHFGIYFFAYRSGSIRRAIADMLQRNFIFLGATALLLMVPLAITSTNGMIKRMGAAKWKRLHELVYISAIAAAIHFWMSRKLVGDTQIIFAVIIGALLLYRVVTNALAQRPPSRRPTRA